MHLDREFTLTYRPPYDWNALLAFLRGRATPGVELVTESQYSRSIALAGTVGTLEVSAQLDRHCLRVAVRFPDSSGLSHIVERVRRMFDVAADPLLITERLGNDSLLGLALAAHPGIRVPGAWDGFELAVRAILGQQVSVAAATTIAGRIAAMFGTSVGPFGSLDRLFPTPPQLANAPIERAGVVSTRADAIRTLARYVIDGRIRFEPDGDERTTLEALSSIRGIGHWTTQYIAMRALRDPDAFPEGDLVLKRMAGTHTMRELANRSEAWRPWRAYAVMLLWQRATDDKPSAIGQRPSASHRSSAAASRPNT
jgi:AraC family transcriptional regulator of adaptative response / DNA-3-methyladenine glycosylase II